MLLVLSCTITFAVRAIDNASSDLRGLAVGPGTVLAPVVIESVKMSTPPCPRSKCLDW